ncbi:uncharacterized protein [Antedon mediterranea]
MSEKSKENGGGLEKEITKDDKPNVIKKADKKTIGIYTKAELMNLSESPASRKKHACLADEFCDENGVWDPEKWHASFSTKSSRGNSPVGFDSKEAKKKTLDPKERLKEEHRDGIVLSPQRRSFIHGCQVNTPSPDNGSNQTPNNYDNRDGHDRPHVRRIGSGRIIPNRPHNATDYQDKGRGRDSRDYRYDSRNNRYDRKYKNHRDDEDPEWFTGGPTSQNDTIELRGFQDNSSSNVEEKRKKHDKEKVEKERAKKVDQNGMDKVRVRKSPSPVVEEAKKAEKKPDTSSKEFDINQFFTLTDGIENLPVPSQEDTAGSGSRFSQWFAKSQSPVQDQQISFLSELQGRQSPNLSASLFMPIKPDRAGSPQATSDILAMLQRSNTNSQRSNSNSVQRFLEQHHGAVPNRSPTPPPPGKVTCLRDLESHVRSLAEIEGDLYGLQHHHHHQNQHQRYFNEQAAARQMTEQTAFNSFLANMQVKRGPGHQPHLMNEEKRSPSPIDLVLGMGVKHQSPLPWKEQGMPSLPMQQQHVHRQNHMSSPQVSASLQQLLQTPQANQSMMSPAFSVNRIVQNTLQPPRPATRTPSPANADALSVAAMLKQIHNQPNHEQHIHAMAASLATEQQLAAAAIMKQSADAAALSILQQQQKEILQHVSASPAPTGRALSPQEHVLQQVLYQQAAAAAVGRGPSPANIGGTSPLQATTPIKQVPIQGSQMNMLTPGGMQPSLNMNRIPSPQELAAHTQNILHNAVIKRQLEVQKEKFLAREAARKGPPSNIPLNHMPERPTPTRPPVTPAFTPTSVIRKMHETKAEAKHENHERDERVQQDLFMKLDSVSDEPNKIRPTAATSKSIPYEQPAFDIPYGSPSRRYPQQQHQQYQPHSQQNNLDISSNPKPQEHSPVSHHQNPAANHDGINYKRILEIQRQQQQKAAMAAAAGQSQQKAAMAGGQSPQASPSGQAVPSGMARPMHHGFPIQMMQRAPIMRGIPHGMQVPNTYQQQMQRGGVGGMSPMMMNTRAAFPGAAMVQAGLVQNQNTPLGARREFNLGNQPVNFGKETPTRASPVNLAKWFGNDLLQHPMPQMPQHSALGQRVISVEELERQQQAVG